MTMTKQIMIGGQLVSVPVGYLKAEEEFTVVESKAFYASLGGPVKEKAREDVLAKRIEFYDLYVAGKVTIPEPEPVKETLWQRIQYHIGLR